MKGKTIKMERKEVRMDKKVLFCGGGNMAENIMRSFLTKGVTGPENVTVQELLQDRCDYLKDEYKVNAVTDASAYMDGTDLFLIAVHPDQVDSVTRVIKDHIKDGAIVLSIAAGVTVATLEEKVGSDKKVVRVMPNTLSQAGSGYSAVCTNGNVDADDKKYVSAMLDALGQTMYIEESMFDTFTAFSCSGAMWVYKLVEALIDAGVYVGFSRKYARNIVVRNLMGVGGILDITGAHPCVKVDELSSPGGVTVEGLKVLESKGFKSAVVESMDAAVSKARGIK